MRRAGVSIAPPQAEDPHIRPAPVGSSRDRVARINPAESRNGSPVGLTGRHRSSRERFRQIVPTNPTSEETA
jgi:hypothetical protein